MVLFSPRQQEQDVEVGKEGGMKMIVGFLDLNFCSNGSDTNQANTAGRVGRRLSPFNVDKGAF